LTVRLKTWLPVPLGPEGTTPLPDGGPERTPGSTSRSEFIADVPEAIRAARRHLGFDYGKFDFVIHQGQPILLDTNSTPACSGRSSPRLEAIADELAAGLFAAPRRFHGVG